MSPALERANAVNVFPTTLNSMNFPPAYFPRRWRVLTTVHLPDLWRSIRPEIPRKANLGYTVAMNKRKRVAVAKHRRKDKKMELKRKAQSKS
jgi:hypothetical protein